MDNNIKNVFWSWYGKLTLLEYCISMHKLEEFVFSWENDKLEANSIIDEWKGQAINDFAYLDWCNETFNSQIDEVLQFWNLVKPYK